MFTWSDEDLNEDQSRVVKDNRNIFLVACPGSGKTKTLTYKIAYELSCSSINNRKVVAITYTHRAADEIRERIEDLGINTARLWIGTIHAFCLEWILKPYCIYDERISSGCNIIDMHQREELLKSLCNELKSPKITNFDCDYYYTSKKIILACKDENKHGNISIVLENYFDYLRSCNLIDFELLLKISHDLIASNPKIPRLLSSLFEIILIDEFQDTKEVQYSILASILSSAKDRTRLFLVGDPNQAIYGSLGGYPITIEELRHITDMEIEEFTLNFNYRSSSKIIDYYQCFKVFDSNIIPKGHNKEYPSVVRYNKDINSERIVDEIASKVVASVDDHNISPDQICIIAPQWFYLASITRKLASKLPMYKFNGPGLSPIARDVENFWYKLSRIALTDPSPQMYMRRMRWAKEILEELSECGVCLDEINERKFLRCCNTLNIMHANGLEYLQDFFDKALSACNIDIAECQYLLHKNEYFFESSKLRIERLQKENIEGADSIEYFKSFFDANKGINVSTIHGVKGGEYDVVIAFGLLDGMVPHFTEKEKDLSSKKLLYVIGSRARKYLYSETGRKRKFGFYSPTEVLKKTHYEYN